MCEHRSRSKTSAASTPTSIATHAHPVMKRYPAGLSAMSVATAIAHRPSHASEVSQFMQLSKAAVPP